MKIKVSELVSGQVFRFPNKSEEYVVNSQNKGDINCIKLEDYDKFPPVNAVVVILLYLVIILSKFPLTQINN